MIVNILEQIMVILFVGARCAATVAICYYALVHYGEGMGKFWICFAAIVIGLGFSLKYDNPNNQRPICKDSGASTTAGILVGTEKTNEKTKP